MSARPEDVDIRLMQAIGYTLNISLSLDDAAKVRAALHAAGFVVEQGWQPIESAPRDGTPIIGWCPEDADSPAEAHRMEWYQQADTWIVYGIGGYYPTHWRPLPAAPKETT